MPPKNGQTRVYMAATIVSPAGWGLRQSDPQELGVPNHIAGQGTNAGNSVFYAVVAIICSKLFGADRAGGVTCNAPMAAWSGPHPAGRPTPPTRAAESCSPPCAFPPGTRPHPSHAPTPGEQTPTETSPADAPEPNNEPPASTPNAHSTTPTSPKSNNHHRFKRSARADSA
jgi:hypothetical protein